MNKTILIVEDESILAIILQNLLLHLGYACAGPLATGEETLLYPIDQPVDAILMDIELAGQLNGIETARRIRRTSDIPIIFLTGCSQGTILETATAVSPYCLTKPVSEKELAATLQLALQPRPPFPDTRFLPSEGRNASGEFLPSASPEPQLGEIIDAEALQTMMEQFYRLTGIGIGILDRQGNALVSVGWQDICTRFHRRNPETLNNCRISGARRSAGTSRTAYRCRNNMWDLLTPIDIDGRHVGNVCLGQFFFEDELPDYDLFREQARTYGFDEAEYLAALDRVPRWPREKVAAAIDFYASLAKMISNLSYSAMGLSRALVQKDIALRQLDESRKFLEATVMMIPDVVYLFDLRERKYIYFNREQLDLPGHADEGFQAAGIDLLLSAVHPQDLSQVQRHMEIMAQTMEDGQHEVEYRIRNRHDAYQWFYVRERVYQRDEARRPKVLFGIMQDITERKAADEERKRLQSQLIQAQKMEAIGTLAGGIAHDFNNILGAILGYAEMVREDSPPDSMTARDLDQIILASNRAKDLVKQILAFSRQADMAKIPLQPASMIRETIKLLRSSLPATIAIEQSIDPDVSPIFADPTQIHQILMNICTNAFHAMEEHGGTLSISLTEALLTRRELAGRPQIQPGRFVRLSVGDTGQGILPEIKDRIFEPYFTTKEQGKGTGLGLAIVHGIVKSHGGFIACESRPGEGTVFDVLLPAIIENMAARSESQEDIPTGSEHILFIDDESILTEMAQVMLERLGYEVTVRSDSLEAMATFANNPQLFDLVITDQTMPGMTGLELARGMLRLRPDIPIILCTGYSSLITEEKTRAFGIRGFALKPLARKEIAMLIRRVLDCRSDFPPAKEVDLPPRRHLPLVS